MTNLKPVVAWVAEHVKPFQTLTFRGVRHFEIKTLFELHPEGHYISNADMLHALRVARIPTRPCGRESEEVAVSVHIHDYI